jgi:23S rRNA (cytidine1920-2'-O)/16S rRNA (cytidine1409-2'-O)-methyltransferase
MKKRERADRRLVAEDLAVSEAEAGALILAGKVFLRDERGGRRRVQTAGQPLEASARLEVDRPEHPFVSRGGVKLAAALDRFLIDPRGKVAADIGVSTGGFTDVLLQRGAARVHAVDVGYGQTAWKIRTDPRVRLYERTNARLLPALAFGEAVALLTIDVSFIRLREVLPALIPQLAPAAQLVALIKPQFEVDPSELGEGGIVLDPTARRAAVDRVIEAARTLGLSLLGEIESPLTGADGNREHLAAFRLGPEMSRG